MSPHDPSPYRASPAERPLITLREYTPALGVGRTVALVTLLCALAAAMVPFGADLTCVRREAVRCELEVHRGLFSERHTLDLRGVRRVVAAGDPTLRLSRAVQLYEFQSDPGALPLPEVGLYLNPNGGWSDDERLHLAAQAFFVRGEGTRFAVRQRTVGARERAGWIVALFAPLLGLFALVMAERRTRRIDLTIDPNARHARGRSVGFGGATLDRDYRFGQNPRAQRMDDPSGSGLAMVRVVSDDGATLPLLTSHDPAHRATFDRLIARANEALTRGTDGSPSPSGFVRIAPSVALFGGLIALVLAFVTHMNALPGSTGVIEVVGRTGSCEIDGMALLIGGQVQWHVPAGRHERTFRPHGYANEQSVTVDFEVAPDEVTRFDCGEVTEWLRTPALRRPARLRAVPKGEAGGSRAP